MRLSVREEFDSLRGITRRCWLRQELRWFMTG
jgi:hypothetical protein